MEVPSGWSSRKALSDLGRLNGMALFPGVVLGIVYACVMLAATHVLRRTKFFKGNITPKTYLRVTMILSLAMCVFMLIVDHSMRSGPWIILFLVGFQAVAVVTSYLAPEEQRRRS